MKTLFRDQSTLIWLVLALSCTSAMAFAYYMQYVAGLEPCNLCMLQRMSMIATGIFAWLGLFDSLLSQSRWQQWRQITLGVFASIAASSGLVLAARHVWLQHLPAERVPACGPPFDYLVEQFPMVQVVQDIFMGSGDCAKVDWQLFGLSMPEHLLWVFSALVAVSVWQTIRSARRS